MEQVQYKDETCLAFLTSAQALKGAITTRLPVVPYTPASIEIP